MLKHLVLFSLAIMFSTLCGCYPKNNVFLSQIDSIHSGKNSYSFELEKSRFLWRLEIHGESLSDSIGKNTIEIAVENTNNFPIVTSSFITERNVVLQEGEVAVIWKGRIESFKRQGVVINVSPEQEGKSFKARKVNLLIISDSDLKFSPGKLKIFKAYYDGM